MYTIGESQRPILLFCTANESDENIDNVDSKCKPMFAENFLMLFVGWVANIRMFKSSKTIDEQSDHQSHALSPNLKFDLFFID